MSRQALNIFLLLALVATVGFNWALRPGPTKPNFEYFPNMAHSPRYNAFSPNPNFPDGKTLREPEPGTLPRGFLPIRFQPTAEDAARAGEELQNPLAADKPHALERGALVYTNFCQTCHGPGGAGNGPVSQRGFPPPASLTAEKAVHMKDGQMFHILTYGQRNMPSYATQLSREDRWTVIVYVRSLQQQAATLARGGKP